MKWWVCLRFSVFPLGCHIFTAFFLLYYVHRLTECHYFSPSRLVGTGLCGYLVLHSCYASDALSGKK